jgi:hypothetical protein
VDLPLWEEAEELGGQQRGICTTCGELVQDPDDVYCSRCLP